MASLSEETGNCYSNDEQQQNKAKEVADLPKHEFSIPWEDSDLVLIVENQKLHVHSLILTLTSPVFKAMLSGDFKEKNAREIVLPGKKADQFVDFLRQIYPQFHFPIQLRNVGHIYTLADEYQTKAVITLCLIALKSIKVTGYNVSIMIDLAQKMGCNKVRQRCYKILNDIPIDELTISSREVVAMDKESLHEVLVTKAKRLENCLKRMQPQFVGVLDCLLSVWGHEDNKICNMEGKPPKCQMHMRGSRVNASITTRLKCEACVEVLNYMTSKSHEKPYYSYWNSNGPIISYYYSTSGMYFDENIVSVLQEMVDILQTKEDID